MTFVLSDIISSEEETAENKGDKFAQTNLLMMYYKSYFMFHLIITETTVYVTWYHITRSTAFITYSGAS